RFSRDWSSDVCSSDLPQMVFDLAGGRAGLAHLIDHLQPAIETWMDDLGNPRMTPELRERMVQGTQQARENKSFESLLRYRDSHRSEERRVGKAARARA